MSTFPSFRYTFTVRVSDVISGVNPLRQLAAEISDGQIDLIDELIHSKVPLHAANGKVTSFEYGWAESFCGSGENRVSVDDLFDCISNLPGTVLSEAFRPLENTIECLGVTGLDTNQQPYNLSCSVVLEGFKLPEYFDWARNFIQSNLSAEKEHNL